MKKKEATKKPYISINVRIYELFKMKFLVNFFTFSQFNGSSSYEIFMVLFIQINCFNLFDETSVRVTSYVSQLKINE